MPRVCVAKKVKGTVVVRPRRSVGRRTSARGDRDSPIVLRVRRIFHAGRDPLRDQLGAGIDRARARARGNRGGVNFVALSRRFLPSYTNHVRLDRIVF